MTSVEDFVPDEVVDDAELITFLSSINKIPRCKELEDKAGEEEEDNGLPSKGAVLHTSGDCNPCSYFLKPAGCKTGRNCAFCHICNTTAAVKRNQKISSKARKLAEKIAALEREQKKRELYAYASTV